MSRKIALLALLLFCLSVTAATAVRTRSWTEDAARLREGVLNGIAVTSNGSLFLAPTLSRIEDKDDLGNPAYVWSMVSDRAGNIYLGTGPDGRIIRIDRSGKKSAFFRTAEPMVTALAVLPGGDLLAGTSPEGKLYRIRPDGRGDVWSETGERYVWDLAVNDEGEIFAATGEHGIIYKIDDQGSPETFFDSSEPHIVTLVTDPGGGIIAGGAGKGLVYRIDSDGHPLILHDDELPEVSTLALTPDGAVLAGLLSPPRPRRRQPALRIQLPGTATVGASSGQVEGLDDRSIATMRGLIEGLPAAGSGDVREMTGRVIRILENGTIEELWRSMTEAPFVLDTDDHGHTVLGCGEPARFYRIDGTGDITLLATMREAQVTGLLKRGSEFVIATSNPAEAYRLRWDSNDSGVFLSKPFDAGVPARWGEIRWRSDQLPGLVELFTRTGNSSEPDDTWSGWSPALTDPTGSRIDNPDGRFLQWRVRMAGGVRADSRISGVSVSYVPYNRPPAFEYFRISERAAAVKGQAKFTWRIEDPDGDPVSLRIQYRRPGDGPWSDAVAVTHPAVSPEGEESWNMKEDEAGSATWDTSTVEEAEYDIRVLATDQPGNHPGEGKTAIAGEGLSVVVDRTPPSIQMTRGDDGSLNVRVSDALSRIVRLEFIENGRTIFLARSVDGVCDSTSESFHLPAATTGDGSQNSLRAVDEAGNIAEQPL